MTRLAAACAGGPPTPRPRRHATAGPPNPGLDTAMSPSLPPRLVATVLCALFVSAAAAEPRTPASDTEVLQVLPTRLGEARPQRERLQALRADPTRLPLALALAREALERARASGDPRELGPAQAALAPWWALPAPPAPVRLLRATLRQHQHDFPGHHSQRRNHTGHQPL